MFSFLKQEQIEKLQHIGNFDLDPAKGQNATSSTCLIAESKHTSGKELQSCSFQIKQMQETNFVPSG